MNDLCEQKERKPLFSLHATPAQIKIMQLNV